LAYGDHAPDIERCLASLDIAAKALEARDLAKASVAAVLLKLPDLSVDAFARLAADPSLKKYSPGQPRDERGRWIDGGDDKPRQTAQADTNETSDERSVRRVASSLSLSEEGLAFIARHEHFEPNVYLDEANHPTIGFGHRLLPGESFPHAIDEKEARRLLTGDVSRAETIVQRNVAAELAPWQFDALVSFAYNVGGGCLSQIDVAARRQCRGLRRRSRRVHEMESGETRGWNVPRESGPDEPPTRRTGALSKRRLSLTTRRSALLKPALLMLSLLALMTQTRAETAGSGCLRAEAQTELTLCAIQSRDAADAALQRTYQRVMEKVGSQQTKALLRRAQKSWAAYKDNECEFESSGSRGGSIHPMQVADCQNAMIHSRIMQLEHQLSCDETDPSCVP
jgi:uncharacterized protein YecT (DUF1311 family)/GH24 family phage-related lysozyme (muramidase)